MSLSQALKAVAFVAMTLAWLVPNHYPPWTSFYNECAMAVALLALFALWATLRFECRRAERVAGPTSGGSPTAALVLVVVAAVPWLQWSFGTLHFTGDAVVSSVYILGAAAAIFVGAGLSSRAPGVAPLLATAALAGALVSTVIVVSQVFGLVKWGLWAEPTNANMRALGNLAQPNNLATLLGLGALGALFLFERGRLGARLAFGLALPLVFACALTQSRMSLSFGVLVLAGVYLARRRGVPLRTSVAPVAVLMLAHWILMAAMPVLLRQLFGESPESLAVRGLATPRYQMWRMLIESLNLVPWTGYGWLQVGAAEFAVVDRHPPIRELWLQGHDIFIELVVWCGWPLGLLLGAALIYWFASRAWRVRSSEALIGMLAVGFVGAHALVELSYHYAYFLLPAALWAGVVENAESRANQPMPNERWMWAPSVLAAIMALLILIEYPAVEEDYRLVRLEAARIELAEPALKAPSAPMLSALTGFLRFVRTEPVAGMSADELRFMEAAALRYPFAPSLLRLASVYALNGRMEDGRRTFIKIRYIFGDETYLRFRTAYQTKYESGPPPLSTLAQALPPPSELRP